MKLLAQLYACLAIIVFIVVIGGIEARSTISSSSSFMTSGNRRYLFAEHEPEDQHKKHILEDSELQRERRAATFMTIKDQDQPSKQADKDQEQKPPRSRRHVPKEDDIPKKPQADNVPEEQKHRSRRQMPGGSTNPKDMAKQMPRPGGI